MQSLTMKKILEINFALMELGKLTLPIGYQIAKNYRATQRLVKEFNQIKDEEVKKRAELDEEGNVIQCLYSERTGRPVTDSIYREGEKVPKGMTVGAKFPTDEARKETEAILKSALDEEHEISLHTIDEEKVEELDAPGLLIEALMGTVITVEEEPQEA